MPLLEKRYAEALVDIAVESKNLDGFESDFNSILHMIEAQIDLKMFLFNSEVKTEIKKEAVRKILGDTTIPELTNFLLLILDKGRIKYLPEIFKEFVKLADKRRNVLNIKIISAVPVEESQVNEIKDKFGRAYNAYAVEATVELDTSLIGGVKVVIGDKVMDGTVKGRLESLREILTGS